MCSKLGYEETTTDFSAAVQAVMDAGCDSAVLVSYSADGAMIIETMAVMGATIPTFGADGIAGESALNDYTNTAAANGVQVTCQEHLVVQVHSEPCVQLIQSVVLVSTH